jgi:hypothetical protein
MARFEGMDEILQRVREQLQEPDAPNRETPRELPLSVGTTVAGDTQQFDRILEVAARLQSDGESFAQLVSREYLATLTDDQQQHLLAALGAVLHELWGVEDLLQRTPPRER